MCVAVKRSHAPPKTKKIHDDHCICFVSGNVFLKHAIIVKQTNCQKEIAMDVKRVLLQQCSVVSPCGILISDWLADVKLSLVIMSTTCLIQTAKGAVFDVELSTAL